MKISLIAVALAGLATVAALPTAAAPFDGPYVGATAGWNRDQADRRLGGQAVDARAQQDSLTIGAYGGYNKTLGNRFVLGGEIGFSGAIDDRIDGSSAGRSLSIDPRYSFDIGARAGVLADPKTLVYVRGGYINSRVRTTVTGPAGALRASDSLDGWQVGGGVERALTDRISARLEYRYSDFGTSGGRFDRHQTLVGISYNF